MHLSEHLNVAVELFEVRTGEHGLRHMLRNGHKPKGTREAVGVEFRKVLDMCRGEKGAEMRKNAEYMKAQFFLSWGPDGVSRRQFNAFLAKYGIDLI